MSDGERTKKDTAAEMEGQQRSPKLMEGSSTDRAVKNTCNGVK